MQARPFPSLSNAETFPSFTQASYCFITFEYGAAFPPFILEVRPGHKINQPATPPLHGHRFDGWFLDAEHTSPWDFNRTVSGDNFTLYAKWAATPFTITYYLSGGLNHPLNPATYSIEDPDITLQNPSRGDDDFIAWYEDAMFSRPPVKVIFTSEGRDIILYARFLTKRKIAAVAKEAKDIYEGDPKLYLTPDGANIRYEAGQPVMEKGLENQAFISLFTRRPWCGNVFLPPGNQVGSDFEKTCTGSITLKKLADIEDAAVRALASKAFPFVDAAVQNPKSDNLRVGITVKGGTALSLTREGALWKNQRERT